jgi:ACS family tartrate transporter-like MFS transporter
MVDETERSYLRKVLRRIIPLLFFGVMIGYIGRANIAFASLRMNADLGLSPTRYGWAAGIFFLGYFCFEIPGTMALGRLGARFWMSFLVACWGVLSLLMGLVESVPLFFLLRFLLGVAEAGFFPGTILYMAHWVPRAHRGRLGGYFMTAVPFAMVVGGPLSTLFMGREGVGGLHGWQWLFIVEGLPCFLLAATMAVRLDSRPEEARWLTDSERAFILAAQAEEDRSKIIVSDLAHPGIVLDPRLWLLLSVTFGGPAVATGVTFWLPQTLASAGLSITQTGLLSALPFAVAGVALGLWGAHSDRTGEHKWHLALPLFAAAIGLLGTVAVASPVGKFAMLLFASLGMFSYLPVAWSASHALFRGTAAPIGYGIISMSGALAGFVAPTILGVLREQSGGHEAGIVVLAGVALAAGLGGLAFGRTMERQRFDTTEEMRRA